MKVSGDMENWMESVSNISYKIELGLCVFMKMEFIAVALIEVKELPISVQIILKHVKV